MILVPELNYWFSKFILQKSINIQPFDVSIEVDLDDRYIVPNSVMELLFNNEWRSDSYNYLFKEKTNFIPELINRRISIKPHQIQIFESTSDSTAINLFNFTNQDLEMIEILHNYRHGENLLGQLQYSDMISDFSKLIFIYLDFKINNNIEHYTSERLISDRNNMLNNMFEAYIIDEIYKDITTSGYEVQGLMRQPELVEEVEYITLTQQDIDNKYVDLQYEAVYPSESILTISGGPVQIYDSDYVIKSDGQFNKRLSWADIDCLNGIGLEDFLSEGDILIIRYSRRLN